MNPKELKKKLGLSNSDIAQMFGYKNMISFATSSAKSRIENGLVNFYKHIEGLD